MNHWTNIAIEHTSLSAHAILIDKSAAIKEQLFLFKFTIVFSLWMFQEHIYGNVRTEEIRADTIKRYYDKTSK